MFWQCVLSASVPPRRNGSLIRDPRASAARMAGTHSKPVRCPGDAGSDGGGDDDAQLVSLLRMLSFVHMSSFVMVIQARPALVMRFVGGDNQAASQVLASMTAGGAFLEFCANPLIGRLSDRLGRRPFLLLGPLSGRELRPR